MLSKILWHGSPHPVASEIEPRTSGLHAIWLTGDPEIAALYAGPEGFIHGFILQNAAILDATGDGKSEPWRYPSIDQWREVADMFSAAGYDLSAFDCLCELKIQRGFRPPLSPEGAPSWEAIFDEVIEFDGEGEEILRRAGYDGVARNERPELALGDRHRQISRSLDPFYLELASKLQGMKRERRLSVAMLDQSAIRHVATLKAETIIAAERRGGCPLGRTGLDDLVDTFRQPEPVQAAAMAM